MIKKILVAVIFMLLFLRGSVENTDTVRVDAPYEVVVRSLTDTGLFHKWFPGFKESKSGASFYQHLPNGIVLKANSTDSAFLFARRVPQSNSTDVFFSETIRRYQYYFNSQGNAQPVLTALKNFTESTTLYYGFNIVASTVTDTIVLTITSTCSGTDYLAVANKLYHEIDAYSLQNNAIQTSGRMLHLSKRSNDEYELMVGVPVNKILPGTSQIKCTTMPKGNILIADYSGPYALRNQCYNAVRQYLEDYGLSTISKDYEKFVNPQLPSSENDTARLKIYFPVL